jgi:hypothetical protein
MGGAGAATGSQPPAHQFPVGTSLVTYDAARGRTYFATPYVVQEQRTGSRLQLDRYLPPLGDEEELKRFGLRPEARETPAHMEVSADGRSLLLRFSDRSLVVNADNLSVMRRLNTPTVWWEGSGLGYLRPGTQYNMMLVTGGRRRVLNMGGREVYTADSRGRYFLVGRAMSPRTEANGYTPLMKMQLWERTKHASLVLSRVLTEQRYDEGSDGMPQHVEALSGRAVVFGIPWGGGSYDYVCAVNAHGMMATPLKDGKGDDLVFEGSPLIADRAIVGLAKSFGDYLLPGSSPKPLYLYRVTEKSLVVTVVASDVTSITYHPSRGIGFGVADKDGVSVRWGPPPGP